MHYQKHRSKKLKEAYENDYSYSILSALLILDNNYKDLSFLNRIYFVTFPISRTSDKESFRRSIYIKLNNKFFSKNKPSVEKRFSIAMFSDVDGTRYCQPNDDQFTNYHIHSLILIPRCLSERPRIKSDLLNAIKTVNELKFNRNIDIQKFDPDTDLKKLTSYASKLAKFQNVNSYHHFFESIYPFQMDYSKTTNFSNGYFSQELDERKSFLKHYFQSKQI